MMGMWVMSGLKADADDHGAGRMKFNLWWRLVFRPYRMPSDRWRSQLAWQF